MDLAKLSSYTIIFMSIRSTWLLEFNLDRLIWSI